jgi:hypothetical protein
VACSKLKTVIFLKMFASSIKITSQSDFWILYTKFYIYPNLQPCQVISVLVNRVMDNKIEMPKSKCQMNVKLPALEAGELKG